MELKICHLYPDVLNLYGDRGDIISLCRRLEWRGIRSEVTRLPIGEKADLGRFDLIFIGGGQDFEQQVLLEDLHRGKDAEIRAAVEDGVTFLTICGGYQMLGSYYETFDGKRCDFIGVLDLYTVGSKERMIGNYSFRCEEASGGSTVVGFENHSGRTWLGSGAQPLGRCSPATATTGRTARKAHGTKTSSAHTATGPCCRKMRSFATFSSSRPCSASTAMPSSPRSTTPQSAAPTMRCSPA